MTITGSQASSINVLGGTNNNAVNVGGQGNPTLTIDVNDVTGDANPDLTINAVLQSNNRGAGSNLVMNGPGTLLLTANNTYAGTTTINGGTLRVGNNGTSGTLGTGDLTNNGALIISRSDSYTFGGAISGSGSLTSAVGGTLRLNGALTYTGPTTISSGTLIFGGPVGSGASATSGISLAAGTAFAFSPGSASTISLPAGSTLALGGGTVAFDLADSAVGDKIAVDTLTLTANNNFTFNYAGGLSFGTPYTLATYNTLNNAGSFTIAGQTSGRLTLNPVIGANAITVTPTLAQAIWNNSSGGNWSTGPWINYVPSVAGDAALFGASPGLTSSGTVFVNVPETVGFLTIDNTAASYTIGSSGSSNLTFDNGPSQAIFSVFHGGSHTLAENVTLNSTLVFSIDPTATLSVTGSIGGVGGVTKDGPGTLDVFGINSYSGATTVIAGLLQLEGERSAQRRGVDSEFRRNARSRRGRGQRGGRHDRRRHDPKRHPHRHVVHFHRRHCDCGLGRSGRDVDQ